MKEIEFYQQLLENQQNYFNSTLTTITIVSGAIIALITIWGFVASKQQIRSIAKNIIKKELKKNEQLTTARTYLIFSDLFYKNKQYEASVALQLISVILFLKVNEIRLAQNAIEPSEPKGLVGLKINDVKKHLYNFGYDYKNLATDLSKNKNYRLVESKIYGNLERVIKDLK